MDGARTKCPQTKMLTWANCHEDILSADKVSADKLSRVQNVTDEIVCKMLKISKVIFLDLAILWLK